MEKQKRPYTDETKLESDKQFLGMFLTAVIFLYKSLVNGYKTQVHDVLYYTDKNMVKESMSELISILSANRPKDPLQFMFD